jgi:D-serine deaminase-like pyridoxal phosphate-dependent protein
MTIDDLPTPALLIDRDRLSLNLDRMQARARTHAVTLRPHVKTHKSVRLAREQIERGAEGLTVAKPSEAVVFADAGFDDLRVAYPVVGEARLRMLVELSARATISFCVDTLEGAQAASDAFSQHNRVADVLVEIDTGHWRTGRAWNDGGLVRFARAVGEMPGLRLVGLLTHEGHSYAGPPPDAEPRQHLKDLMAEARDRLLSAAERLGAAGLADPDTFELSMGSTPTMRFFQNHTHGGFRITEIRPGNYPFGDAQQVALGASTLHDCALTVLATVVSKRRVGGVERLFLDAGKKVLTSDLGYGIEAYGIPLYNARAMRVLPHLRVYKLSEEHAWCEVPGAATVNVGDRVRLVPNHACVTVATREQMYLVDPDDEVVETIAIDARDAVL